MKKISIKVLFASRRSSFYFISFFSRSVNGVTFSVIFSSIYPFSIFFFSPTYQCKISKSLLVTAFFVLISSDNFITYCLNSLLYVIFSPHFIFRYFATVLLENHFIIFLENKNLSELYSHKYIILKLN